MLEASTLFLLILWRMEFNKLQHVPSVIEIKQVAEQLKGVISETPLEYSASLSARYGANVYLKREDLQVVRSYKIRGAYHKISNIPSGLRSKGVVAASAGNHAQGVALACALLEIQAHIFMPKSTPLQKVEAVRFFGKEKVRIYLVGETYDEAFVASRKFCETNGAIYIPPFDDFDIIAGQATVTLEILQALPEPPDYLFLAIGGGGLAAGAALVLPSSASLIGVEPAGAPSMQQSLAASEVVVLDEMDRFVDGASVKQVGAKTFAICAKGLSRMLTVTKKHLCQTMLELYALNGMIVEPAGALSIAGLVEMAEEIKGKTVVCVISGGNFDPKRFPEIKSLASS
jgi:threonine dehydratase